MNGPKSCDTFELHPFRKLCKECHKPKEEHPLTEEDTDDVKKHLNFSDEESRPAQNEEYAWIPPNCPLNRLEEYFKKFPEDQVPRHNSSGQTNRLKQLIYQVPLSDISVEKCRFTEREHQTDMETFIKQLRNKALRLGIVKEWNKEMSIQCPRCLLILEPEELVILSSQNGGPCFHPNCFKCLKCKTALMDLIHCSDLDGTIFCVRHYCDANKKRCHTCDELIFASRYAMVGQKFYHKNHLICFSCNNVLQSNKGYEKDGELFCGPCYETKFSKDCAKCKKAISVDSRHVTFKDSSWHFDCFQCHECEKILSDNPFEIVNEKFYCSDCYNEHFAPKCEDCSLVFDAQSKIVKYEDKMYHILCFKCIDCNDSIGTDSFVPHNGKVYCKGCHLRNYGIRCFRCKYTIIDEKGVMYNKEPYHETCFTCYKCSTQISKQPFKSIGEKWYCMNCYADSFCKKCSTCGKPILLGADEDVLYSYQDYQWHAACFVCSKCETPLAEKRFIIKENTLTCENCIEPKSKTSSMEKKIIEAEKEEDQEKPETLTN